MQTIEIADPADAKLSGVHADDKALVRDCLTVLQALHKNKGILKDWHVRVLTNTMNTTGYDLSATVDTSQKAEWEIHFSDLDVIKQLDFARVGPISVRGVGGTTQIKIHIISKCVPVMVTEVDIVRLKKRTRWFA